MSYQVKRAKEYGENTLVVTQDGVLKFKMILNHQLVFATISHIWLYVLEQTPYASVATEVNLEHGIARSYTINGNAKENITKWSYDTNNQSWNLL